MRVAIINIPIPAPWLGASSWITVPPQGYGGIQWVVSTLIEGLVECGAEVLLLGAPGSPGSRAVKVIDSAGSPESVRLWIKEHCHEIDVIHDHSCGEVFGTNALLSTPYLATWHMTGTPRCPRNPVFLSEAQRRQGASRKAPVLPIPVNLDRFQPTDQKKDFLLFLGRVSPWKGAYEAAAFAAGVNRRLIIAGPVWDQVYRERITNDYSASIDWTGEVGGTTRQQLLSEALALLVLSQSVPGPWGDIWVEPGATVVSEAAASGTPVVATSNGCLREIVPGVGVLVEEGPLSPSLCQAALGNLPLPDDIMSTAKKKWDYRQIASEYLALYSLVMKGAQW